MDKPMCQTCGREKKPIGRDAPDVMAMDLCGHDCPGYLEEPKPSTRWPGEEGDRTGGDV